MLADGKSKKKKKLPTYLIFFSGLGTSLKRHKRSIWIVSVRLTVHSKLLSDRQKNFAVTKWTLFGQNIHYYNQSINQPERSLTLGRLCTLRSVIFHRHRFIFFFRIASLFKSAQFCDSFQIFDADRMISFFLFHLFILHLRDIDSIDLITFISFRVPSKFFGKAILFDLISLPSKHWAEHMTRNERFKLNRIMTIFFLLLEKSLREKEKKSIFYFILLLSNSNFLKWCEMKRSSFSNIFSISVCFFFFLFFLFRHHSITIFDMAFYFVFRYISPFICP